MKRWLKIDKATIFTGNDENGNRYLSQFLKDYQQTFNPDLINAGCQRCLEDYYHKFTKYLSTMSKDTKTEYKLKAKYEGIPLAFGSRTQVYNSNLTDEMAEELLKTHPRGKELFEVIPEKKETAKKTKVKKLTDHTRPELDEMAEKLGINPKDYSNKDEVASAIEDVRNATLKVSNSKPPAGDTSGSESDDKGSEDSTDENSDTETESDEPVKGSEEGTQDASKEGADDSQKDDSKIEEGTQK